MSVTPNRLLPLMEPSQSEPEVVYNAAMEILDVAETLEVEHLGSSPGVRGVTKIKFSGASVTDLGGGVIEVTIDATTGAGGSLELTDGTHDLTGVTKITVVGATVGGTAGAATLTVTASGSATAAAWKLASNQSVVDSTNTPIDFDTHGTSLFDTGSYHGAGSGKFTASATGLYVVTASVLFDASTSGLRELFFCINGVLSTRLGFTGDMTNAAFPGLSTSTILSLTAGDYVQAVVFQNSGGTINLTADTETTRFCIAKIG